MALSAWSGSTCVRSPVCSSAPDSESSCDQLGDGDGGQEDPDCYVCDPWTANPGTYCADGADNADESVCQAQCYDNATDALGGACTQDSDCAETETCRGRCDTTHTCNVLNEGAPTPLVAADTGACIALEHIEDIVGTRDLVTGEEFTDYEIRSITHIGGDGALQLRACPVCQGSCVGGDESGEPCFGSCDVSGDECLTDADCTLGGDTVCTDVSDVCTGGGMCATSPVCNAGPNSGKPCRPWSDEPLGLVSPDCPPDPTANITGTGVVMDWEWTTKAVSLPPVVPCDKTGWENFDCPCPSEQGQGGAPTGVNGCAPACDAAGPNFGNICADGQLTVCVGGTDAGAACDEDTDCEDGGTCSGNPTECTAGKPSSLGDLCAVDADCDSSLASGDGVCGDSCPGGRCLPVCITEGACVGGLRPGGSCAVDNDCGGGTCGPGDQYDGVCAAGPSKFRCSGNGFTTVPCSIGFIGSMKGCEWGDDGVQGTGDDVVGSGFCLVQPKECFANDGLSVGGDTTNGLGDPSNFNINTIWCTPASPQPLANEVSGFGGPQRIRRTGTVLANFSSIDN